VKQEIDKMLNVKLIFPMEESDWISPIMIEGKKTSGIHVCIDFHELNKTCIHDPFMTSFNEFLEKIVENEALFYRWVLKLPSNSNG
jgi:hypothetical protein